MAKRMKVGNRHDAMASQGKHHVSTKAHRKGHLKITVAKKGGKKHHKGGHKTLLT